MFVMSTVWFTIWMAYEMPRMLQALWAWNTVVGKFEAFIFATASIACGAGETYWHIVIMGHTTESTCLRELLLILPISARWPVPKIATAPVATTVTVRLASFSITDVWISEAALGEEARALAKVGDEDK
jgi:hypothetical protein